MGEIRAVVKVDGLGRAGDPVTVQPGGLVGYTNPAGEVTFTGLTGTYGVSADIVRTCGDGSVKTGHQTQGPITVPETGTVELPTFVFQLCSTA